MYNIMEDKLMSVKFCKKINVLPTSNFTESVGFFTPYKFIYNSINFNFTENLHIQKLKSVKFSIYFLSTNAFWDRVILCLVAHIQFLQKNYKTLKLKSVKFCIRLLDIRIYSLTLLQT